MADVVGSDLRRLRLVQYRLTELFELYGYDSIDVPLLESPDLYLRKAGGDVVARLYSLVDQGGRRLSLRPEYTASVIRAFTERHPALPLPVRWQYTGPVLRYERPQRDRQRQFNQLGVELIGVGGPRADAEVLHLACRGLRQLAIGPLHLVVGHVGTVVRLLDSLELSDRVKTYLVGSLAEFGRTGVGRVRERLEELGVMAGPDAQGPVQAILGSLDQPSLRLLVESLLHGMNIELVGGREPQEIVDRLLRKLRGSDEPAKVERALAFMAELTQIRGEPGEALAAARRLLARYELPTTPMDELEQTLELLGEYQDTPPRLTLDCGLARGLAYYTGMVFEIYHDQGSGDRQFCGGGRYDGLVKAVGGSHDVPAAGFAYYVERVVDGLPTVEAAESGLAIDALVVASEAPLYAAALSVAEELRRRGQRIEIGTRERALRANLRYAARRGIRRVLVVEPNGTAGAYQVRELATAEAEE